MPWLSLAVDLQDLADIIMAEADLIKKGQVPKPLKQWSRLPRHKFLSENTDLLGTPSRVPEKKSRSSSIASTTERWWSSFRGFFDLEQQINQLSAQSQVKSH